MNMIHDFLHQFKNTFAAPSFQHFSRVVMGFAQITGPKAVTEVNDSANWSRHHSTIYDFFRKGKWQHQYIAQDLMLWYLKHCKSREKRLKFLSVKAIVKPLQTPWYKPKGRASLKRVQQWMRDAFQGNGIFKGVSLNGFPSINPTNHDFITLQGA